MSALASGVVLLDGKAIEIEELDRLLAEADKDTTAVWYYREGASKDAPPHAMAVIQLVVKHKLRISISSKPDFSDYVDAKGVSHPRTAQSAKIPDVVPAANIEEIFGNIRKIAAGGKGQGGLVLLRPNRTYLEVPPMAENPELKKFAEGLARLIPPGVQRNVAVISFTEFGAANPPSIAEVNKAIPFFGLLMGLTYLGHAVWIFEGHASAFAAGCRDADALIIDSAILPLLPHGWQETAARAMRNANMLVHDRADFQLKVVRKVGAGATLEFATQPARA
ncbi:MAG TPA: hypothetical protein VF146_08580 [Bryobacteraceae bacterium]